MCTAPPEIITQRACLRRMHEDDFADFARMNADPEVMRYFAKTWTAEDSRAAFEKMNAEFDERGFGVYALELDARFAGAVGLSVPSFQSWFTPCVEILWRLQPEFWGMGLATEAAIAVLKMAAQSLSLEHVYAFTVVDNLPSLGVMRKIGMKPCDPPSFDHPHVNEPRLRRHLLYSITLG